MKLFYSPGACSLSPHIALAESGLPYQFEKVNLRAEPRLTESGADFRAINSKGYVPALQLDNGEILTEGPALVQRVEQVQWQVVDALEGDDRGGGFGHTGKA